MHWKSQPAPQPKREISVDRISQLTLVPLTIASLFGLLLVVSIIRQPAVAPQDNELPPQSALQQQRIDPGQTGTPGQTTDLNVATPPKLTPPPTAFASGSPSSPNQHESGTDASGTVPSGARPRASLRESMDLTELVRQNAPPSGSSASDTHTSPEVTGEFEPPLEPSASQSEASSAALGLQLEAPRPGRDEPSPSVTSNHAATPPQHENTLGQTTTRDDLRVPANSTPALPELRMPQPPATPQLSAQSISVTQPPADLRSTSDDPQFIDAHDLSSNPRSGPVQSGNEMSRFATQGAAPQELRIQNSNVNPNNRQLPDEVIRPIAEQVRHGGQLAGKGALFSARDKLQHALYLIANARSTLQQSNQPTQQLDAAMTAMREADEFSRQQQDPNYQLDLAAISAAHRTPVLKGIDVRSLTAIESARRYYEYAGQNLIDAMGREPVAAEALYSLGKLHIMQHGLGEHGVIMPVPKAVIFFQAAVMIDSQHHRAANELGVQLARLGEFAGAREALLMSVATQPSIAAWRNLAFIHRQLNEQQLAQLAENEALIMERREKDKSTQGVIASPNGPIQFVPASQFGESDQSVPAYDSNIPNAPSTTPATSPAMDSTQANRSHFQGSY